MTQKIVLKDGRRHPEFICPACQETIGYDKSRKIWACLSCAWAIVVGIFA